MVEVGDRVSAASQVIVTEQSEHMTEEQRLVYLATRETAAAVRRIEGSQHTVFGSGMLFVSAGVRMRSMVPSGRARVCRALSTGVRLAWSHYVAADLEMLVVAASVDRTDGVQAVAQQHIGYRARA